MRTSFLIMLFVFVAIGCANTSIKPTALADGTKGFIETCYSTKINDCYDTAYKECHEGYVMISNKENNEEGTNAQSFHETRNLTFQCKNQVGDQVKESSFEHILNWFR